MTSLSLRPAAAPEISLSDLRALVPEGQVHGGHPQAPIHGITLDSRQVQPGDLYAALPGAHFHGARFAAEAAAAGAVAVFTDPEGARLIAAEGPQAAELALLVTANPREGLGRVAAAVYGDPTSELRLLGVTGTNGKTTVSYLLDAGLRAAGHRTGLIGTVQTSIGDAVIPSVRTTPEAPELQALFAAMRERGVDAVTMEVSSHALALHRVDGSRFAGAAFTNLSQDHLDFHPTIEDYFQAKALLFDSREDLLAPGGQAVVNIDDPYGQRLTELRPGVVTYSLRPGADWSVADVALDASGSEFSVVGPGGARVRARVQLPGSFNVSNALCAVAVLVETGVPLHAAIEGIAGLCGVPGRMERVDAGQPFLALVDYAHTPAAVSGLLETVRQLVDGRVITVLGCGGDRDRGKRPLMGAAVVEGSDLAILTSDNPRSEDSLAILAEMRSGADRVPGGHAIIEPDRSAAIRLAVQEAKRGDAVVIAGKGHETGQDIAGVIHPFDDRDELRGALNRLSVAG